MTDAIVFIDALSPRELEGFLSEIYHGDMDAGSPRVTPRVMSSIYTGESPAENGMMEVSRYGGAQTTRPKKSTFIDQSVREGMSVVSMGMPFCVPFDVNPGDIVQNGEIRSLLGGVSMQQSMAVPQAAGNLVTVPAPREDMIKSHPDEVFTSFHDQTVAYFNTFKENIRQLAPDVALIGYRLIDSYCHFQHTETREGRPYRQHLIEAVAGLCERVYNQIDGDLLFFSDHGQTELTSVFRANRWLAENGYLSYDVDYNFVETFSDWQGEDHPVDERVENQITFGQPGVVLNEEESQVVCSDPFDSCLTLLCPRSEFDAEAFRDDLMATGMYRSVKYKWELWDENADFYDETPDIIPDRADGVFVSGNLHREPVGMGYYRTGVHDRGACFGATRPLNVPAGDGQGGAITPEQMYDVICDFMGLEITTSPVSLDDIARMTPKEREILGEMV